MKDDKESLDLDITEEELTNALKTTRNNSAPGIDGITTSLLQTWPNITKTIVFDRRRY